MVVHFSSVSGRESKFCPLALPDLDNLHRRNRNVIDHQYDIQYSYLDRHSNAAIDFNRHRAPRFREHPVVRQRMEDDQAEAAKIAQEAEMKFLVEMSKEDPSVLNNTQLVLCAESSQIAIRKIRDRLTKEAAENKKKYWLYPKTDFLSSSKTNVGQSFTKAKRNLIERRQSSLSSQHLKGIADGGRRGRRESGYDEEEGDEHADSDDVELSDISDQEGIKKNKKLGDVLFGGVEADVADRRKNRRRKMKKSALDATQKPIAEEESHKGKSKKIPETTASEQIEGTNERKATVLTLPSIMKSHTPKINIGGMAGRSGLSPFTQKQRERKERIKAMKEAEEARKREEERQKEELLEAARRAEKQREDAEEALRLIYEVGGITAGSTRQQGEEEGERRSRAATTEPTALGKEANNVARTQSTEPTTAANGKSNQAGSTAKGVHRARRANDRLIMEDEKATQHLKAPLFRSYLGRNGPPLYSMKTEFLQPQKEIDPSTAHAAVERTAPAVRIPRAKRRLFTDEGAPRVLGAGDDAYTPVNLNDMVRSREFLALLREFEEETRELNRPKKLQIVKGDEEASKDYHDRKRDSTGQLLPLPAAGVKRQAVKSRLTLDELHDLRSHVEKLMDVDPVKDDFATQWKGTLPAKKRLVTDFFFGSSRFPDDIRGEAGPCIEQLQVTAAHREHQRELEELEEILQKEKEEMKRQKKKEGEDDDDSTSDVEEFQDTGAFGAPSSSLVFNADDEEAQGLPSVGRSSGSGAALKQPPPRRASLAQMKLAEHLHMNVDEVVDLNE